MSGLQDRTREPGGTGRTAPDPDYREAQSDRDRVRHLTAHVSKLKADRIALLNRTVRGYRAGRGGGAHTVAYAEPRVAALRNEIDHDVADGDKKHNRVPGGMKALVVLPLLTDFLIVLLFLTTVFNVSLGAPLDATRVRL